MKFMTAEEFIEKRVAMEIIIKIREIYFSEEYSQYRIDYDSNGMRDLLIDSIRKMYNI